MLWRGPWRLPRLSSPPGVRCRLPNLPEGRKHNAGVSIVVRHKLFQGSADTEAEQTHGHSTSVEQRSNATFYTEKPRQ